MRFGAHLVLLAAGGTGGHMFPAEALAAELIRRGHRVALVTDRRGATFVERIPEIEVHRVSAGGVAGGSMVRRARGYASLALGVLQARRLVMRLAPHVAVGFGGYASIPAALAAARAEVPLLLHEQNAVLGRANRLLASRAARIAVSFPSIQGLKNAAAERIVLTGNPVRPAIAAIGRLPYVAPTQDGAIRILVLGGSLGARVFGRVLPEAIARLPEGLRRRLSLSQQARADDVEAVRNAYARLGVVADVSAFFDDVPARLAAAHLGICRSGASTVAELAAAGRPAILVPYPFAADDHQTANARALSDAGAAWIMPERALNADTLAERLLSLFAEPTALSHAAACAQSAGHPDAAQQLADLADEMIHGNGAQPREAAA